MKISKQAKLGIIKTIDEDHEIAVATDGNNIEIVEKCLAKDVGREE